MFEQIAIHVPDVDEAVERYVKMGFGKWVQDMVSAHNVFADLESLHGSSFVVDLAFNYNIVPGKEFELISPVEGRSCQLQACPSLSHMGFHVEDLESVLLRWSDGGYVISQLTQTTHHTGTKRRYWYAFVDAWKQLGYFVKIIQRFEEGTIPTLEETAERFKWIGEANASNRPADS